MFVALKGTPNMAMGKDLWYRRDKQTGELITESLYPELNRLSNQPDTSKNFSGANKCQLSWPDKISINGKSLSRNEITRLTGIDRPRVGRIFNGKAGVNVDTLDKIAAVFGVTTQQLVGIFSGNIHPENLLPIVTQVGGTPVTIEATGSPTVRPLNIGASWGHDFKD